MVTGKLAALEAAATEAASEVVCIGRQIEQKRGRDGVEESKNLTGGVEIQQVPF
jgi:hypothetical protein